MKPVTLRRATCADAPAVQALHAACADIALLDNETLWNIETAYCGVVAERDGVVVGFACAQPCLPESACGWNAETSICLVRPLRRKGVGAILYKTLLDLLKCQGVRRVYSRIVLPNAAAKNLHEALHFKQEWVQKKACWQGERWHDVLWCSKQLAVQSEAKGTKPAAVVPASELEPAAVDAILASANEKLERLANKPRVNSATHKSMQGNKSSNTKPELIVRKLLREMGLGGYRLHWKAAPGRPDIVYPGRKIAIFVHGCFWHRCPECALPTPRSNVEFWEAKFKRNVERDAQNVAELEAAGWTVLTVWEHQLKGEALQATRDYLYEAITFPRNAKA